jgi:hypothetical protein
MIFGAYIVVALSTQKVQFSATEDARWGSSVKMKLLGGGNLSFYQPQHTPALDKRRA